MRAGAMLQRARTEAPEHAVHAGQRERDALLLAVDDIVPQFADLLGVQVDVLLPQLWRAVLQHDVDCLTRHIWTHREGLPCYNNRM